MTNAWFMSFVVCYIKTWLIFFLAVTKNNVSALLQPWAQWHTFTVSLSHCCCLFKWDVNSCCYFSCPIHFKFTTQASQTSSSSSFYRPICLRRVINHHHHQCLDSNEGFFLLLLRTPHYHKISAQSLNAKDFLISLNYCITCCNQPFLYFSHLSPGRITNTSGCAVKFLS